MARTSFPATRMALKILGAVRKPFVLSKAWLSVGLLEDTNQQYSSANACRHSRLNSRHFSNLL